MADIETYTVTKLAGPKVAGIAAKAGDELQLTEAQARAELLAGAIVKGGKADAKAKDGKDATDPFAGSDKLADIQARARGLDKAPEPPAEAAETKPAGKAQSEGGSKGTGTPPAGGSGSADAGSSTGA